MEISQQIFPVRHKVDIFLIVDFKIKLDIAGSHIHILIQSTT